VTIPLADLTETGRVLATYKPRRRLLATFPMRWDRKLNSPSGTAEDEGHAAGGLC
jgi:hypothetical protein